MRSKSNRIEGKLYSWSAWNGSVLNGLYQKVLYEVLFYLFKILDA